LKQIIMEKKSKLL